MYLKPTNFSGKKVILRVDFNVPIIDGTIQSTKRIDAVIPTINIILKNNPERLFIISHLGRPKGIDMKLTLKPVMEYINRYYNFTVGFSTLDNLQYNNDRIVLLENIRFYYEETKELPTTVQFRKRLTGLADIFINDAFGCCHRSHSSIVGIDCPEKYLGLLVRKELKYLKGCLNMPGKKTLILGGSKVGDKIKLINNLIPIMDNIIIGGGMAFTFLKKMGMKIGDSLFDEEGYDMIEDIMINADKHNTEITVPLDFNCNDRFSNTGNIINRPIHIGIEKGYIGLDIGVNSITLFLKKLEQSDIIFWNGPMGVFEFPNFAVGSRILMNYLAKSDKTTIIGGGDTSSCCQMFGLEMAMTHVSTGGGASLELLEGNELPGIEFIKKIQKINI